MALAALIVAIISAVLAGTGLVSNRRSTQASEESAHSSARSAGTADRSAEAAAASAEAAAVIANLDTDRRHSELAPKFRITCKPAGQDGLRMAVGLSGPAELDRLDGLTVVIRDPWRGEGTPSLAARHRSRSPRRSEGSTGSCQAPTQALIRSAKYRCRPDRSHHPDRRPARG